VQSQIFDDLQVLFGQVAVAAIAPAFGDAVHHVAVRVWTLPTLFLLLDRGICGRVLLVGAEVDNLFVLVSALALLEPFRRGAWQRVFLVRAAARSGAEVVLDAMRTPLGCWLGRLLGLFG